MLIAFHILFRNFFFTFKLLKKSSYICAELSSPEKDELFHCWPPCLLILFCFWDRILLWCLVWSQTPGQGFLLSHFLMVNDISLCPAYVLWQPFYSVVEWLPPHLRIKRVKYSILNICLMYILSRCPLWWWEINLKNIS